MGAAPNETAVSTLYLTARIDVFKAGIQQITFCFDESCGKTWFEVETIAVSVARYSVETIENELTPVMDIDYLWVGGQFLCVAFQVCER